MGLWELYWSLQQLGIGRLLDAQFVELFFEFLLVKVKNKKERDWLSDLNSRVLRGQETKKLTLKSHTTTSPSRPQVLNLFAFALTRLMMFTCLKTSQNVRSTLIRPETEFEAQMFT